MAPVRVGANGTEKRLHSEAQPFMPKPPNPFENWDKRAENLPPVAEVLEIVGSIYDCALDPKRWDQTLIEIKGMLRCRTAVLGIFDLSAGNIELVKSVGIEPYWLERMSDHHAELASWERLPIVRNLPLDEPQVQSRHLPVELREQSRMAKEWAGPQGIVDSMALVLMHSPTRHAQLGLGRHAEFGPVTEREMVLGRLLVPHIRRAIVIGDLIDLKTIQAERANQVLDTLNVGVVLTEADGRILHANSAAETMMRAGGPIREAGGAIHTNLACATAELHEAIALADGKEAVLGRTGLAVRLTRNGEPPVLAHVLPLKQGKTRSRLQPKAAAAVFLGTVSHGANGAEALAVAYNLTRMETRVLAALLAGLKPKDIAATLGIAMTTTKTHLCGIYAKTGASGQVELVRLAMRTAASIVG